MNNKGFTLLELLLSLTILALIVSICYGVFQTGIMSWEKSEQRITQNQRLRIIAELLKRQVASLYLPGKGVKRSGRYVYFQGTEKTMNFFSSHSLYPQSKQGTVFVRYSVIQEEDNQEILLFHEDRSIYDFNPADLKELQDNDFHRLLAGPPGITFSFLTRTLDEDGSLVWQNSWDQKQDGGLPRAVRIQLPHSTIDYITINIPLFAGHDSKS